MLITESFGTLLNFVLKSSISVSSTEPPPWVAETLSAWAGFLDEQQLQEVCSTGTYSWRNCLKYSGYFLN